MNYKQAYDTNAEMLVQRYKQGIRLVRPGSRAEKVSIHSISSLYSMPISAYFVDLDSRFVNTNIYCSEICGAQSTNDLLGKNIVDFTEGSVVIANNNSVVQSASMKVFEEAEVRNDKCLIHALSFKFPWYHHDEIIGVFGCSVVIDAHSLNDLGTKLALLSSTGLLGPIGTSATKVLPDPQFGDVYFTKRELSVITHLVRGRTAKEIGELLYISKRTAETHIENIKSKTHCSSKSELIDKLIDQFI